MSCWRTFWKTRKKTIVFFLKNEAQYAKIGGGLLLIWRMKERNSKITITCIQRVEFVWRTFCKFGRTPQPFLEERNDVRKSRRIIRSRYYTSITLKDKGVTLKNAKYLRTAFWVFEERFEKLKRRLLPFSWHAKMNSTYSKVEEVGTINLKDERVKLKNGYLCMFEDFSEVKLVEKLRTACWRPVISGRKSKSIFKKFLMCEYFLKESFLRIVCWKHGGRVESFSKEKRLKESEFLILIWKCVSIRRSYWKGNWKRLNECGKVKWHISLRGFLWQGTGWQMIILRVYRHWRRLLTSYRLTLAGLPMHETLQGPTSLCLMEKYLQTVQTRINFIYGMGHHSSRPDSRLGIIVLSPGLTSTKSTRPNFFSVYKISI